MVAEIPRHAIKSPFEAAPRRGDPRRALRPGPPPVTQAGTERGAGRRAAGAAKRKGLQREENIFYWKPSKSQREKTGPAHTPDTRPARCAVCPPALAGRPKPQEALSLSQSKLQNS